MTRSSATAEEARCWETIGARGWQHGDVVVREHMAVGEDGYAGETHAMVWQRDVGSAGARAT